jgi:hypothetical protein
MLDLNSVAAAGIIHYVCHHALATTAMTGPILKWRLPRELCELAAEFASRSLKRAKTDNEHDHACRA